MDKAVPWLPEERRLLGASSSPRRRREARGRSSGGERARPRLRRCLWHLTRCCAWTSPRTTSTSTCRRARARLRGLQGHDHAHQPRRAPRSRRGEQGRPIRDGRDHLATATTTTTLQASRARGGRAGAGPTAGPRAPSRPKARLGPRRGGRNVKTKGEAQSGGRGQKRALTRPCAHEEAPQARWRTPWSRHVRAYDELMELMAPRSSTQTPRSSTPHLPRQRAQEEDSCPRGGVARALRSSRRQSRMPSARSGVLRAVDTCSGVAAALLVAAAAFLLRRCPSSGGAD